MKNTRSKEPSKVEARLRGLFLKSQNGEERAYREFLVEVTSMLRTYLSHQLRHSAVLGSEHAEELVQEVLISVHNKRATYDPSQPILPWLFAIAKYRMIDQYRKDSRMKMQSVQPISVDSDEVGNEIERIPAPEPEEPFGENLEEFLSALTPKQRRLIELTKLQEKSIQETCQIMGMGESAVKVGVHRAMKLMQALATERHVRKEV